MAVHYEHTDARDGTAQPLRENNQRRRFRTVAATPRFTARIPTYVYWRAQHVFTFLIIFQKIMLYTVLIFIGDDRAETYVLDTFKNIALNIRIYLLKVGDQLLGLHAF